MITVYVRNNEIQNAEGTTITTNRQIVKAAKRGNVTKGLLKVMRFNGLNPALGEEVAIQVLVREVPEDEFDADAKDRG